MTHFDEQVLTAVMEKTRAWERLHDPQYCGQLNMESVYDLMLRAGYSKAEARRVASERGWQRLCAGVEV